MWEKGNIATSRGPQKSRPFYLYWMMGIDTNSNSLMGLCIREAFKGHLTSENRELQTRKFSHLKYSYTTNPKPITLSDSQTHMQTHSCDPTLSISSTLCKKPIGRSPKPTRLLKFRDRKPKKVRNTRTTKGTWRRQELVERWQIGSPSWPCCNATIPQQTERHNLLPGSKTTQDRTFFTLYSFTGRLRQAEHVTPSIRHLQNSDRRKTKQQGRGEQ
jgi:hypothetical protein